MPTLDDVASKKLQELSVQGRKRTLRETARLSDAHIERGGKTLISFTCNDYLGLSHHPAVIKAAQEAAMRYGAGAGASRLITGNHPLYAALEQRLATWKGTEAALVFGSGYLANIGIIPALVGKDDLIIADKLVHACLIDGAKLSGAKLVRFKHNDVRDCARLLTSHHAHHRHVLIITDEVFSMDGDVAPLAELKALAQECDAWLMVDSAHALTPHPIKADIAMGTLSKALGSYGGYVTGSKVLIDYLISTARSLIFTTALPPATLAAADTALKIVMENKALTAQPLVKARLFTRTLGLPDAQSPIVPLIVGDEETTLAASQELEKVGFAVAAIRPPTVPEGTSRLRFTFCANHNDKDIARLAKFIAAKGWL